MTTEHQAEQLELSDRDRQMLDFETHWWKYAGTKETAVRETFDLSVTRYYLALHALIGQPEALAYAPLTVKRLQRLRTDRARQRSARRVGFDC